MFRHIAALSSLLLLATLTVQAQPADLVVVNARVYTADDARPLADAFAVRSGMVAFVGSSREARTLAGPNTRVIDLGGRTGNSAARANSEPPGWGIAWPPIGHSEIR